MRKWLPSFLSCVVFTVAGCASSRSAPPPEVRTVLRLTHHVGGTHYRSVVHDGRWYQTFGTELLVLDARSARVLHRVELGKVGESGPAVDLVLWDDQLVVVIENEAVLELALPFERAPRVVARHAARDLGILPMAAAVVEGELYVSGEGGVASLGRGRLFEVDGLTSRVAPSEHGPVVCIGRRVYRVEDGQYVGSASELVEAPLLDSPQAPPGALVFARQADQGALAGLMGPDLRELDAQRLTTAIPGRVRSVRVLQDLICIVTDQEVLGFVVHEHRLVRLLQIPILGARDVARLDDDHLAIAGTFGRTVYRERTTPRGRGGEFLFTHREPSRLSRARTDGRFVLAGGEEGSWLYHIGSRAELTTQLLDDPSPPAAPATRAATLNAEAVLSPDGRVLTITTPAGIAEYREPRSRMLTVIASESDFWVGHEDGIVILRDVIDVRPPAEGGAAVRVAGRFRLDGPVRYLFPGRVGGGAVYVAEFGGFGVARFVAE